MDLFERIKNRPGSLGQHQKFSHGYFAFPKLEGNISNKMNFLGKEHLVWSLNNYLGLANHPEVRQADIDGAAEFGLGYPMGARMMSGNSKHHEAFENELSEFVKREDTFLLNFGYQGIMSAIDALVDRHDVIIYDAESHACIIDGVRLHMGKRFVYTHNDMESLEKQLERAKNLVEGTPGAILVITEGVFGMSGVQGDLKAVVKLKEKYDFRLLIDDAHGFGTMGRTGAGTDEEQDVQEGVDLYFGTFAKSMAGIGAFISGKKEVIDFLRYNMRSQIFAKSLPMPIVIGLRKRLELLKSNPQLRTQLWNIVNALQSGLRAHGFNIGITQSPVTPVFLKGGLNEATNLVVDLRQNFGIFCSLVVYPVVPKDVIMLRLIPSAIHTLEDVELTLTAFDAVSEKLNSGFYASQAFPQMQTA